MNENDIIKLILGKFGDKYIGDDCAFLQDFGLLVSQDNLVEGTHFLRDKITAFQLGWKSAMVNFSDILASGGECKYITIGLSLPKKVDDLEENFVNNFFEGIQCACNEPTKFGSQKVELIGGDLTSGDKIFISITAIGKLNDGAKFASHKNTKLGYKIVMSGACGSSDAGLQMLLNDESITRSNDINNKFLKAHLMPNADVAASNEIGAVMAKNEDNYSMIDNSDGLLFSIMRLVEHCGFGAKINFNKIRHDIELEQLQSWQKSVLFGGEDYNLIACVPQDVELMNFVKIGELVAKNGYEIDFGEYEKLFFTKNDVLNKSFQHFI